MYTQLQATAIDNARDTLAEVAQWLWLDLRDKPMTSVCDRKTAALRVKALEAVAALDAMDDEPPALHQHDGPTPLAVLALEAAALPAISGGAPYQPSEADEACLEYEAWLDALEAGRDWDHQADALHRDLYGY